MTKGWILILLFIVFAVTAEAQYTTSKERKKVLKGWSISKRKRKKMDAYNPYIDKDTNKSKHSVSKREARENKRTLRRQQRMIKKQKRKLRREGKAYKD